jgi:hypothetical protein
VSVLAPRPSDRRIDGIGTVVEAGKSRAARNGGKLMSRTDHPVVVG